MANSYDKVEDGMERLQKTDRKEGKLTLAVTVVVLAIAGWFLYNGALAASCGITGITMTAQHEPATVRTSYCSTYAVHQRQAQNQCQSPVRLTGDDEIPNSLRWSCVQ